MYRKERIADLLQAFLGEEIRRMSDPRLDFVTLTEVRPSKDLKSAKVYWSAPALAGPNADSEAGAFPADEQRKAIDGALMGTKGYLKRRVGEELKLRYVPDLVFVYDQSAETGSRIEELLRQAGRGHDNDQ